MYKNILCPVDFSESTTVQIKFAKSFAENQQAKLSAIHVMAIPLGEYDLPYYFEMQNTLENQARTQMNQICGNAISPLVTRGYPIAIQIVKIAEAHSCDLLLMPTHGYTGWKKIFIGSVFQGVLARTPIPVLALPPKFLEIRDGDFKRPDHVLCAIDLEKGSAELIRTTENLAKEFGASFTVAHNVDLDDYLEQMMSHDDFHHLKTNLESKILREYSDTQAAQEVVVTRGRFAENIKLNCDSNRTGLVVLGLSRSSALRIRTSLYRAVINLNTPVLCVPTE